MPYKVKKLDEVLIKHYRQPVKVSDVHFVVLQRVPIVRQPHSTIHIESSCRCKLKGSEATVLRLFIKLSPSCYLPFRTVRELDIIPRFQKEIHAYTQAIPELTRFQKEEGSTFRKEDIFENIFPKCFGTRLSLNPEVVNFPDQDGIIVLENIKSTGYIELDYIAGLNLESAKMLVGKLALFHAVPIAFNLKHEEKFLEKIHPCLIATNTSSESFVTVPSEVELVKEVLRSTGLNEYQDRINKALLYSSEFMSTPPSDDSWIGMCHGKFFLFNTMILQTIESKQIVDCRIIDLQHLLRRHVLTDLAFLLMTCSAKDLLINHLEEILQHYHKIFVEVLKRLDIDLTPYNYDSFKIEFKINVRKELLRGLQMVRFMAAKKEEKELMRSLSTWPRFDKEKVESAIDRKLYVEKMRDILLNLLQTRLIDED